jgi:hypothetical protein
MDRSLGGNNALLYACANSASISSQKVKADENGEEVEDEGEN